MSEDLTNKLRPSTDDNVWLILQAVQNLTFRAGMSEQKFDDFAERLEQRLQKVSSDIAHLNEGQQRLEEGYGRLEEGYGRLEEGQNSLRSDLTAFRRHVDEQFRTLSGEVEKRYREHDQRITRLENNANQANPQT